jgi:hypothetical protein
MSELHRARGGVRLAAVLFLGVAALLPAAPARALPVAGTGIFVDPVVAGGGVVRGEDTSHLAWGSGRRPRHSLGFSGSRFDADSEGVFSLGTLRYRNGRGAGSATADLLIRVAVATPAGGEEELAFALSLVHTPGAAGGAYVSVAGALPAVTFSLGGTEYQLELLGLEGGAEAFAANGHGKKQKRSGSVEVLARLASVAPVAPISVPSPEPDAALLYLLGLALAGYQLKRR